MPVSTTGIIDRVILVYPELKGGDEKNRIYWVLKFLKSRCLSVGKRTRHNQITERAMQAVKTAYRQ